MNERERREKRIIEMNSPHHTGAANYFPNSNVGPWPMSAYRCDNEPQEEKAREKVGIKAASRIIFSS